MQGYWKNNVEGWDRKGNKRRKQNRNHFLKDKGRALVKTYDWKKSKVDETKYRNETVLVTTYTGSRYGNNKPLQRIGEVYKVRVYFPKDKDFDYKTYSWLDSENTETKAVKAYEKGDGYNKHWYEAETHKPIREFLGLSYNQYWKAEVFTVRKLGEVEIDNSAEIEKRNTVHIDEDTYGDDFVYGKLVPKWKRWTWYNDGKRRKVCQKMANSSDRAALRTFIDNEDWDEEIRTHACSKSIGWCVH